MPPFFPERIQRASRPDWGIGRESRFCISASRRLSFFTTRPAKTLRGIEASARLGRHAGGASQRWGSTGARGWVSSWRARRARQNLRWRHCFILQRLRTCQGPRDSSV